MEFNKGETYSEYQRRMERQSAEPEQRGAYLRSEEQNDPQHIAEENAKVDEAFGAHVVTVGSIEEFLKVLDLNMNEPVTDSSERQCGAEPYFTVEDIFTLADTTLMMGASITGNTELLNRSFQRQIRMYIDGLAGLDGHLRELAGKLMIIGSDMFAGRSTGLHKGEF